MFAFCDVPLALAVLLAVLPVTLAAALPAAPDSAAPAAGAAGEVEAAAARVLSRAVGACICPSLICETKARDWVSLASSANAAAARAAAASNGSKRRNRRFVQMSIIGLAVAGLGW